jgi:uncharacterized protein with ParB-like and HNH nuclease domain
MAWLGNNNMRVYTGAKAITSQNSGVSFTKRLLNRFFFWHLTKKLNALQEKICSASHENLNKETFVTHLLRELKHINKRANGAFQSLTVRCKELKKILVAKSHQSVTQHFFLEQQKDNSHQDILAKLKVKQILPEKLHWSSDISMDHFANSYQPILSKGPHSVTSSAVVEETEREALLQRS